jgi:APA family basic amino acid/polyamine antiporter
MPDAERPYKAWGYPVVPVLFLLVTGFLLFTTLLPDPASGLKGININALIGLALIASGLPVYWYLSRKNRVAYQEPPTETDDE